MPRKLSLKIRKKPKKKKASQKELAEKPSEAPPFQPVEAVLAPPPTSIDVYPINEPYAYAAITRDPETNETKYVIIEPVLSEEERATMDEIKEFLVDELDVNLKAMESKQRAEEHIKNKIQEIVKRYKIKVDDASLNKLMYFIWRDFVYLGKIEPLLRDHMIEDISCDGVGIPLYVWHRTYESIPTNISFPGTGELNDFIVKLAYVSGRHASIAQPIVDAALPDGSRIHLTYASEVTRKGSTFTIRKFRANPLTITDLIMMNTLSSDIAAYFWFLIEHKASVLIAGGTASGKTTFLNCLAGFIRPEMKIVSIEDTPELNLLHENWIQSIARSGFGLAGERASVEISLFDLLKGAMRQRPDYVIVGEIRGSEAYTLFQAIATGHGGISSVHADSISSVIHRLESEPMNIPRTLVTGMDALALLNRVTIGDKPARRAFVVGEIVGLDQRSGELLTNDVYRWNPPKDNFVHTGRSYITEKIMKRRVYSFDYVNKNLQQRKVILDWMVKNKIREYKEVSQVIRDYYANPIRLYEKARQGLA